MAPRVQLRRFERGLMAYTRYRRWNPDGSGGFAARNPGDPKPTRGQTAIEFALFGFLALLIVLGGVAFYTVSRPSHRLVPNGVAAGMKADRINILFIGIGGEAHPSHDDLADSIILVSLKPSTKQAAIISIPRDLWVRMSPYGTHRINYAHEIGDNSGYPGRGPGLLCDTVAQVTGQPVHAFVRLDFRSFEKSIDELGGIDLYAPRGFYDFLFKDGFQMGWHHLNGRRALAYARYRYVLGPEGDNFARELRQQQVIIAVRDRLQRLGPNEALHLIGESRTLLSETETNLSTTQMIALYRGFHDIPSDHVRQVSLKPFTTIFDVTRIGDAGDAVRTRTGDDRELQTVTKNVFSSDQQICTDDQIRFATIPVQPPPARSTLSIDALTGAIVANK